MQVLSCDGIYLPGPDLWLDPHAPQEMAIVSHAHADHMKQHRHVIATAPTAAMMRLRGATRCRFQTVEFNQPLSLNGATVTLFPAGHVLGSSQVLVEWQGTRLLYSGDFKLKPGRSAEAIEVPQADVVVMETTFGRPHYCFPDADVVAEEIKTFCRQALDDGCTPVLLCYSLGKGQEVLARLDGLEAPLFLHTAHFKMSRLYREWGMALPPFQLYQPEQPIAGVLLCAGGCRRGRWFEELKATRRLRTAYISGWAIDRGAAWRFGTDAAFALSDHADYPDLLEYVERTKAGAIYTMHGFAEEFAADLRERGFNARALHDGASLEAEPPRRKPALRRPSHRSAAEMQQAGQLSLF